MTEITILTLQDSKLWHEKLHQLPKAQQDIYYTPEYYSLYQNYGDGKAMCFVFEEGGQLLLYPFLINSVNALGYQLDAEYFDIQGAYGYNGVVSSSDAPDFIDNFYIAFDNWCLDNHVVAEFARFNPLLENVKLASPLMRTINSRMTVRLNLQLEIGDIWMNQLSTKNRNVIRKAEKEGVTVVESDDYETFRQLYNGTMENVSAEEYYFFPESYFEEYKKTFKNLSILCLAIKDGKPIAGSMFMFSNDYAHYHLSARDKNYYKIAANNLILWYGIQKAKERGCKWFHFGGGTTGNEDDRLLHFKRTFSHDSGEFWIGKRVHNEKIYNTILEQWQWKHPDSFAANKMKLLGYREI